jgi:peroxiredoxin
MRRVLSIVGGWGILAACTPQPGYHLSGKIEGLSEGEVVFLEQRIDKQYVAVDSVTSPDGSFEFTGRVDMPDVYYVSVPGQRGKAMIFLENSQIELTARADSLWKPIVAGSTVQDEYNAFQASLMEIYAKENDLYASYLKAARAGEVETMKKLEREMDAVDEQAEQFQLAYLDEHPASYIAPYIVQNLHYQKEADELMALLEKLDPSLEGSTLVGSMKRRLEILKKVAVGMPAPVFTQQDPMGNPVSLSSFRGKYLLIDFWAAWCGPCRRENPNIVAVYQKYNRKDFEVLGVSLDRSRESWLKAVRDDGLTWTQVSDLKYWSNDAAALYGISSIPSNLLLNPEGVIIRKNLRGEDLQAALDELLP